MQNEKKVQCYTSYIKSKVPQYFSPRYAIILGTGLGSLVESINEPVTIPYDTIPDFPLSTEISHSGQFVLGYISNIPVIVQQGRCHLYEGRTPDEVCAGIRVMHQLGASHAIITNAAGSINPLFDAGKLMLITDHINFTGHSPLTGKNCDAWGPRFPDMREVYCKKSNAHFEEVALSLGLRIEKGVYLGLQGPQLETAAETRAYRLLGADAVGMSTVMEAIAAIHMGMTVTGISCLANKNLPDCLAKVTTEEAIETARIAGKTLTVLIEKTLPSLEVQS